MTGGNTTTACGIGPLDHESIKIWLSQKHKWLPIPIKVSILAAYGLAAIFVLASLYWRIHTGVGGIEGDPYLDWSVLFGLAAVCLTFVEIVVDRKP